MTIDEYLVELRRHLRVRRSARRRILSEVEAHLRDSAERVGEQQATNAFGPPAALALRLSAGSSWIGRRLALMGVGALAAAATAAGLIVGFGGSRPVPGRAVALSPEVVTRILYPRATATIEPRTIRVLAEVPARSGARFALLAGRDHATQDVDVAPASVLTGKLTARSNFVPIDGPFRGAGGSSSDGGWEVMRGFSGPGIAGFQSLSGVKTNHPLSLKAVGVLRGNATRLSAATARGTRFDVPLNRWRGFSIYTLHPRDLPLVLTSYGRGGRADTVSLGETRVLCPKPGCRRAQTTQGTGGGAVASGMIWVATQ